MNNQIIKKINDYYVLCKTRYYKHSLAAKEFDTLYNYTTAPITVLTSTAAAFATYNTVNQSERWITNSVTVLTILAAVSHSLVSFFEFNKKFTSHTNTANSYMNLVHTLENDCLNTYANSLEANDVIKHREYIQSIFNKIVTALASIHSTEPILSNSISAKDYSDINYDGGKISDILIPSDYDSIISHGSASVPITIPVSPPVSPQVTHGTIIIPSGTYGI